MADKRFECPECNALYDQHVAIDRTQGCCPVCEEHVRPRAIRADESQTKLGGFE